MSRRKKSRRRKTNVRGKILFFFDRLMDTINNSATATKFIADIFCEKVGEINDLVKIKREFNKTEEGMLYHIILDITDKRNERFNYYINKSKKIEDDENKIEKQILDLAEKYAKRELKLIKISAFMQYGFWGKWKVIKERRINTNFEDITSKKREEICKKHIGFKMLKNERKKMFFLFSQEEYYFGRVLHKIKTISDKRVNPDSEVHSKLIEAITLSQSNPF